MVEFFLNFLACEKLISCSDLGDHGPNDGRWDNDSQDQVSGCRWLPGCLQVPYRQCTMYILVAARYILRSSNSTCLQGPMLVYRQNSDFFFGCYNVRGSGRAAMGKV